MSRAVHLGVGAFHRAHQAWYLWRAGWRVDGASLRSAAARDALARDGWRYALEIADADGRRAEVVDVLDGVTVAPEDPGGLRALIARPETALITITVTEKGYALRAGAPDMDALAPDVAALRAGTPCTTMPGILLDGLRRRSDPVTVLPCDNLPENGRALHRVLAALAEAAGLADPLAGHAFPSCMVDRITPAADDALYARMRAAGLPHAAPVATEDFSEWVIEDAFAGPRPDLPDVQFTRDVAPHELRKLRMLNGAHSALAYAGLNAGRAHVHEAVADADLRALARGVMDEAARTLPEAVRAQAPAYADALIARFENPHLAHRLDQIAMDGSQKLPIRILGTLDDLGDAPACARALREWERWLDARFAEGRPPDDPAADALRAGRARGMDARALLGRAP